MQLKIQPAVAPELRHLMEGVLKKRLEGIAKPDGGETYTNGTECSIYFYPVDGKSEGDIRYALTGSFDEPPWPLPDFDPEDLPSEVPDDLSGSG